MPISFHIGVLILLPAMIIIWLLIYYFARMLCRHAEKAARAARPHYTVDEIAGYLTPVTATRDIARWAFWPVVGGICLLWIGIFLFTGWTTASGPDPTRELETQAPRKPVE